MFYGQNVTKIRVKDFINLFEMNDKSIVTIIGIDSDGDFNQLYKGRVDYLQFDKDGSMHELCNYYILNIESYEGLTLYI